MKILHLEDNSSDALLTHEALRQEWPDCEIFTVSTAKDFQTALQEHSDLIISDYNMPQYNGLQALCLSRELAPQIPFIFLSGTIGEERALEALRSGASDYVIKDRPKRLIPAIKRALQDSRLARERRDLEDQMQRVQRLESIGMLAAGIAHDFNNVLAPLIMGLPLLKGRHPGESDQRIIGNMESSAARGAGLVKQILGFAHGVTGEAQLIQPGHLINEIMDVMRQTFPRNITIVDEVAGKLWPIKANPTSFHQVLLNLCVNARDAMPQGGKLTVSAINRVMEGQDIVEGGDHGKYLALEISDTGMGIPPEILARIWEPFFTTKGEGKGTGLGLSTVRGIITQHHGDIELKSQVGRGTTFTILFPAAVGLEPALTKTALADIPRGQGELILVVDDDPGVREVTSAMLTAHGYRVISAAEGTEAVALFAARSLEIRALVTDLDMPNFDGQALIKVARALSPSVRSILISGIANEGDSRCAPPSAGLFLAKPFSGEMLLRSVHQLLNEQPTATTV
jgi:signal transduction histidine kinase